MVQALLHTHVSRVQNNDVAFAPAEFCAGRLHTLGRDLLHWGDVGPVPDDRDPIARHTEVDVHTVSEPVVDDHDLACAAKEPTFDRNHCAKRDSRRLPHRARAIEVLRLPDNMAVSRPKAKRRGKGFALNVIEGDFKFPGAKPAAEAESVQLPLYGRIAAGTPISAIQHQERDVGVPAGMLRRGRDHYALQVKGENKAWDEEQDEQVGRFINLLGLVICRSPLSLSLPRSCAP